MSRPKFTLRRLFGTSLRRRLAVSIALIHALMMAIFVFDLSLREQQLLIKNTEQAALKTTALLARSSFEWALSRDLAGLGELIRPLANDADIEFAMILDHEGRVLAHSDPAQVGRYVSDPVSLAALRHRETEPRLIQNLPTLIDGIAPIVSERSPTNGQGKPGTILGWARIGMNTERTQAALGKVLRDGLLYTLAAILLGTLLALLIAADLTRDLRRVKALFLRVSAGELDQRIEVGREDELGDLMHGLNHMLERLEADEQLLRETRERLELALQGSNDGLWDWDLTRDTVYFSPRWKAMLGYGEDEIGEAPAEWSGRIHPDDAERTMHALEDHLAGRAPAFEVIHRMCHKDGGWRWILSRGRALRDAQGRPQRMVGTLTDITELKETEGRLAIERSRLASLLTSLHSAVLVEDASRRIALANQAFCDMFHIPAPPEALVGTDCAEAARASLPQIKDGTRFIQRIEALLARHEPALGDIVEMADGRVLERDYSPILVDGVLQGHLWMYRDITARIELEHSLDEQRERLRVVLMSMADGVIVTDPEGRIEFLNPVAEELTGWTLNEAKTRPLEQVAQLMTEDSANVLDGATVHQLMQKGRQEISARLARRGAIESFVEIELKAAPMLGAGGAEGLVLILHDVSETHRLMEQMSWQASHDPLTGLPNRTAFGERLRSLLEGARTAGERHALLYMDLDQFKVVNDTCGHHAGDELLMNIAHLLRSGVRRDDMIARLGGDEFAALLPNCSVEVAERIANQLRESVQHFSFYWQDRVFNVGVSIGIVTIDPQWGAAEEILRAADIACYAAKERGRNRIHVYEAADETMSRQVEQLGMASQIQLAVRESRFVLYAQPLKPLERPRLDDGLHLEVLVRMLDRHGQLIAPGLFISAAERYNLMQAIDRWVVSTTLERLHQALDTPAGRNLRHVGINLSGNSLTDEGMLSFVEDEVRRYAFPPGLICFEITETAIISNMHQALAFIQRMKALGCTFALDDFGSGLSSFAYLKALPVDFLKIDGVFVRDIESDAHDRSFVQAIHQVGRTLGLKTIAEFVENAATEQILRGMGVDFAQGYGVSPPRPLDDFLGDGASPATSTPPAIMPST